MIKAPTLRRNLERSAQPLLPQVVHQFYMPEIAASATFSMTVTSTSGSCTAANVTICAFYLLEDEESNMVIVELDLESGYVAEEASLQRLVDGKVAKKYEVRYSGRRLKAGFVNFMHFYISSFYLIINEYIHLV